jgi:hypothetical protein
MSGTKTRMMTTAATMPIMAEGLQPSFVDARHTPRAGGAWGSAVDVEVSRFARRIVLTTCVRVGAILRIAASSVVDD